MALILAAAGFSANTTIATPAEATDVDSAESTSVSAKAQIDIEDNKSAHKAPSTQKQSKIDETGDPRLFEYWTNERMAKAKPVQPTTDPNFTNLPHQPIETTSPSDSTPSSIDPSPAYADRENPSTQAAKVTKYPKAAGRLFFDKGNGKGGWCTAAAVNSESGQLVITAGHCVHSGKNGKWIKNAVFVPRYGKGNNRPYGTFQAKHFRTTSQWIKFGGPSVNPSTAEGFANDVAFIKLYSGNTSKKSIVRSVGGFGVKFDQPSAAWDTSIFGYPINKSNGEIMNSCWGTALPDITIPNRTFLRCPWGAGSSGGPWVQNYDNSTGLGYIRAVTSSHIAQKEITGTTFAARIRTIMAAADKD